jgi:hypothetical protein
MTVLVFEILLIVAAADPGQQQPNPQNPQNRSPFRPFPIFIQPNQAQPNLQPKPPTPQPGIQAPKRKNTQPPNPAVMPSPGISPDRASSEMSDWIKMAPVAAGLTFYMPEEPNEEKRTVRAGERDLNIVEFVYSLEDDKGALTLTYSDLPASRRSTDSRILDAARDRIVRDLDGKLVNEDRVRVGEYSGVELRVRAGNGNHVRQRLFIKDDRLYQAIAVGPSAFVKSSDVDRFMKSLKFTEVD